MSGSRSARLDLGADRGSITVFALFLLNTMLLLGALVIDGGYVIAAKERASNVAEDAARAGAAHLGIADLREHDLVRPDPVAARRAVLEFLERAHCPGEVSIDGDLVTVEVRVTQPTTLLRLIGVRQVTQAGTATARPVAGVREAIT
jgi:hypothetical protein